MVGEAAGDRAAIPAGPVPRPVPPVPQRKTAKQWASERWLERRRRLAIVERLVERVAAVQLGVTAGRDEVPAIVAQVPNIVMVTPPGKDKAINPAVLVAAQEAGVTDIYRVGGAQAIVRLSRGFAAGSDPRKDGMAVGY